LGWEGALDLGLSLCYGDGGGDGETSAVGLGGREAVKGEMSGYFPVMVGTTYLTYLAPSCSGTKVRLA